MTQIYCGEEGSFRKSYTNGSERDLRVSGLPLSMLNEDVLARRRAAVVQTGKSISRACDQHGMARMASGSKNRH